jgi:hypothetical protein
MRGLPCLLLCAAHLLAPQPPGDARQAPPADTAIIRGRVVAEDTGRPLRLARLLLTPLAGAADSTDVRSARTDSEGTYEFRNLPAGRYMLSAAKAGYVRLEHGQRLPSPRGSAIQQCSASGWLSR